MPAVKTRVLTAELYFKKNELRLEILHAKFSTRIQNSHSAEREPPAGSDRDEGGPSESATIAAK